ncbi:MAG: MFS transporter [Gemmatimonadetes bacterium]|nr:MFS transporter [Gemmatimonadota bacterium]
MYDWANSAVFTVIITAVFPIFFFRVAGAGLPGHVATQWFGLATTLALILIAVISPILGAVADYAAARKRFLAAFMVVGACAVAGMFLIRHGDWQLAAALFMLANIAVGGSLVFYDALLPHVAREKELDRVSTAGYALGYLGGGLLLAICLAWIQKPEWFGLPAGPALSARQATLPARLAFLSVAFWWLLFSIPLLRRVGEPPRALEADETLHQNPVRAAVVRLGETLRELRVYRQAFLMLLAFLIYNDGIGTIIRMATIYGSEIGIGQGTMMGAVVLVQFLGIPFSFLFGAVAGRIGAKRSIFLGLVVYTAIGILAYRMTSALHFLILAGLVAVVQGGTQALSRSLFASLVPRYKSGEFFGFFSVFEKFAGIFGPALFTLAIAFTGSSRSAILSVVGFFAAGAALLALVDVEEGQRVARAAEAAVAGPG